MKRLPEASTRASWNSTPRSCGAWSVFGLDAALQKAHFRLAAALENDRVEHAARLEQRGRFDDETQAVELQDCPGWSACWKRPTVARLLVRPPFLAGCGSRTCNCELVKVVAVLGLGFRNSVCRLPSSRSSAILR